MMTTPSNFTKKVRGKFWMLRILEAVLLFVPLIIYVCIGLASGAVLVAGKVALVGMVMIALILTLFNFLAKRDLRSPLWLILLGLYIAIQEYLVPLIIILAVVSVLDDFILKPAVERYKIKLVSSKTMDEREAQE